jgi:hypothetical protein
MFFELIERELFDEMLGLANRVKIHPRVRDCWEIEAKKQFKTKPRLLKDFRSDRA